MRKAHSSTDSSCSVHPFQGCVVRSKGGDSGGQRSLHTEPFWKALLSFPRFSHCTLLGKPEGTKQQVGGTLCSPGMQSQRAEVGHQGACTTEVL